MQVDLHGKAHDVSKESSQQSLQNLITCAQVPSFPNTQIWHEATQKRGHGSDDRSLRDNTLGGELGATFMWASEMRVWIPQWVTAEEIRQAAQDLLKAADRWDCPDCGGT